MSRHMSTDERRETMLRAGALNKADDRAFLEIWRARGGFAGELARRRNLPLRVPTGPRPAIGHMPFTF